MAFIPTTMATLGKSVFYWNYFSFSWSFPLPRARLLVDIVAESDEWVFTAVVDYEGTSIPTHNVDGSATSKVEGCWMFFLLQNETWIQILQWPYGIKIWNNFLPGKANFCGETLAFIVFEVMVLRQQVIFKFCNQFPLKFVYIHIYRSAGVFLAISYFPLLMLSLSQRYLIMVGKSIFLRNE